MSKTSDVVRKHMCEYLRIPVILTKLTIVGCLQLPGAHAPSDQESDAPKVDEQSDIFRGMKHKMPVNLSIALLVYPILMASTTCTWSDAVHVHMRVYWFT